MNCNQYTLFCKYYFIFQLLILLSRFYFFLKCINTFYTNTYTRKITFILNINKEIWDLKITFSMLIDYVYKWNHWALRLTSALKLFRRSPVLSIWTNSAVSSQRNILYLILANLDIHNTIDSHFSCSLQNAILHYFSTDFLSVFFSISLKTT